MRITFFADSEDDPADELPPKQPVKVSGKQQTLRCLTCRKVFTGRIGRKYCDNHKDGANRVKEHRNRQEEIAASSNSNTIALQASNSVTSTLQPLSDDELPIKHYGKAVTSVTAVDEV